ncbi:hypothetical protein RHGRI_031075 [Rhododendron griersonianum]|uniref:Uncharacterized protein n=1 Tax=Rhododendron griersonianum TaxID=479676 RepID=A0AAV6IB43_9ERIC|nr:hypothetical protein RHGRI_031075 [Rhododendron griersonianum]
MQMEMMEIMRPTLLYCSQRWHIRGNYMILLSSSTMCSIVLYIHGKKGLEASVPYCLTVTTMELVNCLYSYKLYHDVLL